MERPSWNEGRLDDLNRKVDVGIERLDDERKELRAEMKDGLKTVAGEIKDLRGEMNSRFDRVDKRFEKVNEEFAAVRLEMKSGFDRLQWTLISAAAAIIAALIAAPHL